MHINLERIYHIVKMREAKFNNWTRPPSAAPVKALQAPSGSQFSAFSGSGHRLDGKTKPSSNNMHTDQGEELLANLTSLPPVVCIEDYKPVCERIREIFRHYTMTDVPNSVIFLMSRNLCCSFLPVAALDQKVSRQGDSSTILVQCELKLQKCRDRNNPDSLSRASRKLRPRWFSE
ncbi:hypothetical protein KIN20_001361 [Parelaphostrongylus tenuis]|uniref:Uncharacterized protein n=1 Tax=Parelaphostrongylus tenuis TaxID=148309 RepID=A0AAD5MM28_PARTN|nr:hypothetical protein KIN20_001361 [Parelaphostrongylus tenuis]